MSARPRLLEGLGLELEYMIVDRDTLAVRPIADRLVRRDVVRGGIGWSNELALHVVELKTMEPRRSLDGLQEELHENVREMDRRLAEHGARLLPTGAHPFMDPAAETRLWPHGYQAVYAAYDRIFGCRTHGWANLQSVHLNLAFRGDAEFGRLHAAVRLLLPLLPALAASSPLLEGRPTGFRDTRLEVYRHNQRQVPAIVGRIVPERVYTRREYRERILAPMHREIAPLDPAGLLRHEWLNSRGAVARFGRSAVEIRLLDTQECPAADVGIAQAVVAALRALVAETWQPYARQREAGEEGLAAVLLETIRDAEEARIRDPLYLQAFGLEPPRPEEPGDVGTAPGDVGTAPAPTARRLWNAILERCRQAGFLPEDGLRIPRLILAEGSLSSRILRALGGEPSRADILRVYRRLADCLAENRPFRP